MNEELVRELVTVVQRYVPDPEKAAQFADELSAHLTELHHQTDEVSFGLVLDEMVLRLSQEWGRKVKGQ